MRLNVVFKPQEVSVQSKGGEEKVVLGLPVVKEYIDTDPYEGEYEVIPSMETQILQTEGKRMLHDVVVDPIPSNYGLITWDGSVLTVS